MEASNASNHAVVPSRSLTFFDLPTEIRHEIYSYVLLVDRIVDLDPRNYRTIPKMMRVFIVSKQFHKDASLYFYSQNTFRLFPSHGCFFSDRQWPLVRCISPSYRAAITHLELRLGPGWTRPPRSWNVHPRLRLKELISVRRLDVYVEIDPSSNIFNGFRKSETAYTDFAGRLFRKTIVGIPNLEEVSFAGYSSVKMGDSLISRLIAETKEAGKRISFSGSWSGVLTLQ